MIATLRASLRRRNARRSAVEMPPSRRSRAVIVVVTTAIAVTGYTTQALGDERVDQLALIQNRLQLITSDEFSGARGQSPTSRLWDFRVGGGGWGNGEEQVYTSSPRNVSTDGRGQLVIRAQREPSGVTTSARIDTLSRFSVQNGLVQVRARLPQGQGIHPAIWMLGSSITTLGYPGSGEIDIVELVNSGRNSTSALHGPKLDTTQRRPWRVMRPLVPDIDVSRSFHTYWVYKTPGKVVIGVDDQRRVEFTPRDLPSGARWVMDEPFFLVLNVAVGGVSAGQPTPASFPAQMAVDWVRVYQ